MSTIGNHSLLDLLPDTDHQRLVDMCEAVTFRFGQVIVREGELADAAYILLEGEARVLRKKEDGHEVVFGSLKPGDLFGESALLRRSSRTATVRASGDIKALRLTRDAFDELARERPEVNRWLSTVARARLLFNFLRTAPAFERLPPKVLSDLISTLAPVELEAGRHVIRMGDPPGPMYIVESGRCCVYVTPQQGVVRNLAFLREGDVFGEASLLLSQQRSAHVKAVTDTRLLALGGDAFQGLLDRWPEFRRAIEERVAGFSDEQEANIPLDFSRELLPANARITTIPAPDIEERPSAQHEHEHPFESDDGLFRRRKSKRLFPYVEQTDEMDCGAACLAMVCRNFGKRVALSTIRQLANTATDGTNIRNICQAATALGLAARTAKVSQSNIEGMPLPAIIHWEGNHWVVAVEIRKDKVRVADPALGLLWLERAEFERKWTRYAALFDYTDAFEHAPEDVPRLGWVVQHIRPYRGLIARGLVLALLSSLLSLAIPVLSQFVVDRIVVEGMAELLGVAVAAMGVVFLLQMAANGLQNYLVAFAAVRIDTSLLDFLTRRLLALPLSYFQARRTGDIQQRLDGGRQIREALLTSGLGGVLALLQLAVVMGLMLVYSRTLTLVYVAVVPLYGGLMLVSARYLRPLFAKLEEKYGKHRSEQLDAIKGIEAVKASSAEAVFREKLLDQFMAVARQQLSATYVVLGYQSAVTSVGFLSSVLFLYAGARLALAGELTLGGFIAFNSLVLMANAPLGTLLSLWDDWQRVRVHIDRLSDVLLSEPEQGRDHGHLLPVRSLSGRVELRNVSFRFGGPDSPWILKDIDLDIPAGKTVAIVGRSGSGKTTLVRMIGGLTEPTEGAILFDGLNAKTLNYRDLRAKMGFVLQDTHIFSGTISENITFGGVPDMDRMVKAARAAAASEFIERLPLGYDTIIGEAGVRLSGGQKQRVAIARALYRVPAILLLDEATSALDTESEQAVQESIRAQLGQRTTFVVAHRLSTVRDADEIIVLDRGEIVERGVHEELMDRRGIYFYLVNRQVEA